VSDQYPVKKENKREVKRFHKDVQFYVENGADFDRGIMPGITRTKEVYKSIEKTKKVFDKIIIDTQDLVEGNMIVENFKMVDLELPDDMSNKAEERMFFQLTKASQKTLKNGRTKVEFLDKKTGLQKYLNRFKNIRNRRVSMNKKIRNKIKNSQYDNLKELKMQRNQQLTEERRIRKDIMSKFKIHRSTENNFVQLNAEDFLLSQKIKYKIFISRISGRMKRMKNKINYWFDIKLLKQLKRNDVKLIISN
jgi:hypothetical protein